MHGIINQLYSVTIPDCTMCRECIHAPSLFIVHYSLFIRQNFPSSRSYNSSFAADASRKTETIHGMESAKTMSQTD